MLVIKTSLLAVFRSSLRNDNDSKKHIESSKCVCGSILAMQESHLQMSP